MAQVSSASRSPRLYLDATHTWERAEAGKRHGRTLFQVSSASAEDRQAGDMSILPVNATKNEETVATIKTTNTTTTPNAKKKLSLCTHTLYFAYIVRRAVALRPAANLSRKRVISQETKIFTRHRQHHPRPSEPPPRVLTTRSPSTQTPLP